MSSSFDLNFIDEIGATISDIYANDPSQSEWFESVKDEYNNTEQYPDDTIQKIKDYLYSHNADGDYTSIIEKIDIITAESDEAENLLGAIFFPNFDEDVIDGDGDIDGDDDNGDFIISDEEDQEEENDKDSPSHFFKQILTYVSTTLCISTDISYLLLKKYGWNKDQSLSNWFSQQDQILKEIGIKPTKKLPDSLEVKECGEGKCPLCGKNGNLYQLYCGHKICKKCLDAEVETQIGKGKLPLCRQKNCNSEIIIKSSMYPQLFEQYKEALLRDKLENNSIDIRPCPNPNCGYFIQGYDRINKYVGRCPHCFATTCYKCNNGSHAPLEDCSRINEFCQKIPDQIRKLVSDQNKWEIREMNLKEYRCKNKDEVIGALKDIYQKTVDQQKIDISSEKKKYDELCQKTPKLNKQIEDIKGKIRESVKDPKLAKEINQLSKQIISTRQDIDRNERIKKDFQAKITSNDESRQRQLSFISFNNEILTNGLSSPSSYKDSITKFHEAQISNAFVSIGVDQFDPETSQFFSEYCPKCQTIITRFVGINKMQCKCGFNLCKVCHSNWNNSHDKDCSCPKYMLKVDCKNDTTLKDQNDKKFYPPPMTLDKAIQFVLFENYYAMFMRQKEIYNKLKADYYSYTKDSLPQNKLFQVYAKDNDYQTSEGHVTKLFNTILFAQSMITWSYPTIFFAIRDGNDEYADFLKKSFASLSYHISEILIKIKEPQSYDSNYFKIEISKIENEIQEILEDDSKFA